MNVEVIEEPQFTEAVECLAKSFPRIYEVRDALDWTLSRSPSLGKSLPGFPEWRVYSSTNVFGLAPSFWFLMKLETVNGCSYVYLYDIKMLTTDNEE